MKRGPKIICLRRKVLAAVGCVAAAFLMCWVAASPEVVGAASTERQLGALTKDGDHKKVVVVGGLTGCEIAILLAAEGASVTVVEMLPEVLSGVFILNKIDTLEKLQKYGVRTLAGNRLASVSDKGVCVQAGSDGAVSELDADLVVLALGVKSENALYGELVDDVEKLFVVGDAQAGGRIANATHNAHLLAAAL